MKYAIEKNAKFIFCCNTKRTLKKHLDEVIRRSNTQNDIVTVWDLDKKEEVYF